MRKPDIHVRDPKVDGTPLGILNPGEFFRFPASAEGKVYVVIEQKYDARPVKPVLLETGYVKLDDGKHFSSFYPMRKNVNVLHLVSAEFELEGSR